MRKLLKFVKFLIAHVLRSSGLIFLLARVRLKNKCAILMYHRVIDEARAAQTDSSPGIIVPAVDFDMQMRVLREIFNPISLTEFQHHLEHGTELPEKSCLVTFDDGWLDNYEIAFPVLQKYGIPAAIFLPCNYISNDRMFWQEELLMRLTSLLTSGDRDRLNILNTILNIDDNASVATIEDIRNFVIELKSNSDEQTNDVVAEVRDKLQIFGEPEHYNRYMSWEQISEMNKSGISFGSHALSHRILCRLADEQCENELVESKNIIEGHLGVPVTAIAYPNGDYDDRVIAAAEAAGYMIGLSTDSGLFDANCSPLSVPRVNIHGNNGRNEALFLCTCLNIF